MNDNTFQDKVKITTKDEINTGSSPLSSDLSAQRLFEAGYSIAADLGAGALDEVMHHPLHVAEQAAIGAGIALGASLVAPELAIGLTGVAIGAAAYGLYENAGGWMHSAAKVAGWEKSTSKEMRDAHLELQQIGADGIDVAAGAAGGLVGLRAITITSPIGRSVVPIEPAPPSPTPALDLKIALGGLGKSIGSAGKLDRISLNTGGPDGKQVSPIGAFSDSANAAVLSERVLAELTPQVEEPRQSALPESRGLMRSDRSVLSRDMIGVDSATLFAQIDHRQVSGRTLLTDRRMAQGSQ